MKLIFFNSCDNFLHENILFGQAIWDIDIDKL